MNFAALEERLKSCEADVDGHRDRVQEDRNRLRSLQALRGRYSLERRKAIVTQKRLMVCFVIPFPIYKQINNKLPGTTDCRSSETLRGRKGFGPTRP